MPSTRGVSTRSKNADQHPGLAAKKRTRRSSKEVAAERQAKEDAKQEKARTKAAGIKRVAEYEIAQANKDAAEATPRVAPKAKPLARTRSYANVLKGSDDEMSGVETSDGGGGDDFNPEDSDIPMTGSNTETESVSLPPKKKKKVAQKETTQKETVKKEKVPKPQVRDAIKAIQAVGLEEQDPATNIIDLDPTPKPKRTKHARPAPPATEFGDWSIPDQEKPPSWRMPAFSDNDSIDVKSMAGARGGEVKEKMMEKAKGKGKQKASEANTKASDQIPADTKRVPPKSKSDSTSNGKKFFSAGINDWAASIPSNAKPTNKRSTSTMGTSSVPPLTNASTHSTASSVLSKNVKITTKVEPADIGIQIIDGALSDEDETLGFEREAAVMSPPKGKKRATSAAVVRESPAKAVRLIKRTKKLSNNDLPDGVDLKTWRRSFVSTYMQYAGSAPDPWDIPAKLACEKMQLIWDDVFPGIEYKVTSTSTVYYLALQRNADSWRNTIGSASNAILTAYFESQDELKDSNENRIEFAKYALDKFRFLYHKADGDDKENFRGLYRGAFVVQTLGTHFSAIAGARKIPGVDISNGTIAEARGALALSCVSVQRALTLVATGTLTIEMIHAAKGQNVTLPKTLNHSTGKISNRQTGFNDITWGATTRKYVRSISKAYKKKPEKFDEIITRAKEFSKKSRRADDGAGGPDGDASEEDDNLDEELIDISSSEEDNSD